MNIKNGERFQFSLEHLHRCMMTTLENLDLDCADHQQMLVNIFAQYSSIDGTIDHVRLTNRGTVEFISHPFMSAEMHDMCEMSKQQCYNEV